MRRFSTLAMLSLILAACISQIGTVPALADDNNGINERSREGNGDEASASYDVAIADAWSSRVRAGFGLLKRVDARLVKQFKKAWFSSNSGINNREGLVLIFRMLDGSYRGKSINPTGEYKKLTFKWNPSAVAIVHTHPNKDDPKPSEQDQRVAEKLDVPIFTITIDGMYVYDPSTKITIQVMDGLDWLDPSKWAQDVYRNLIARFFGERNHRPIHSSTIIRSTHKPCVDTSGSG
ncbi:MAG: hypothetical protein AB1631_07030 [Acidobacteriota bacterium]